MSTYWEDAKVLLDAQKTEMQKTAASLASQIEEAKSRIISLTPELASAREKVRDIILHANYIQSVIDGGTE